MFSCFLISLITTVSCDSKSVNESFTVLLCSIEPATVSFLEASSEDSYYCVV